MPHIVYRCNEYAFLPEYSFPSTYPQHGHAINDLRKTEVCHLDHRGTIVGQQHVLRLEVSVRNSLSVDILARALETVEMGYHDDSHSKRVADLVRKGLRLGFCYFGELQIRIAGIIRSTYTGLPS